MHFHKVATSPQLTWSHYTDLLAVSDEKTRDLLSASVEKSGLSVDELRQKIKDVSGATDAASQASAVPVSAARLVPLKGTCYTYRIVRRKTLAATEDPEAFLLDLGFGFFRNISPRVLAMFSENDIVETSPKDDDAYRFSHSARTEKDLYTYNAIVERVTDADTLHVRIDLGFDSWVRQTLRLRGLDAPELKTREGEAARAFVSSLVKEADRIVIRSSRSDKYDRYLADVFLMSSGETSASGEMFLNNLLLEKGFATRM
jgi:endonuclease YncB( thermonuclease family)